MRIRGLIFDLDGTLLNTLDDIADSWNTVLKKRGYPTHPVSSYKFFVGEGAENLVHKVIPKTIHDEEIIEECLRDWKNLYSNHWNVKTAPYDGIASVLQILKSRGLSLSVLSNKYHEMTKKMVEHFFGDSLFNCIIGAGQFAKKPDPHAAEFIASDQGIPPEHFLFLGDSGIDMQTASAAGMHAAGVLWGFRDEKELRENGANYLLKEPADLILLIENFN